MATQSLKSAEHQHQFLGLLSMPCEAEIPLSLRARRENVARVHLAGYTVDKPIMKKREAAGGVYITAVMYCWWCV